MNLGKQIKIKFGFNVSLIIARMGEILHSCDVNKKLFKKADNTLWDDMGGFFIHNEIVNKFTFELYNKINHYGNR